MIRIRSAMITVAVLLASAVSVSAHHSFAAEYDAKKPVTVVGKVTKIVRTNPHGWIYVDVKDADGAVKNWAVETNTPSVLARRGLTKEILPIGTELKIQGYRAKDGSPTMNGNVITFPDGRDIMIGSEAPADASGAKPEEKHDY